MPRVESFHPAKAAGRNRRKSTKTLGKDRPQRLILRSGRH